MTCNASTRPVRPGLQIRAAYAIAGWRLWTNGQTYYATTTHGRVPRMAETICDDTPIGCLRKVLGHPSMRSR